MGAGRLESRKEIVWLEEWAQEQRFLRPSPVQLRSQFNVLCGKAMDTARSFLPKTSWTIVKSAPKSWVSLQYELVVRGLWLMVYGSGLRV